MEAANIRPANAPDLRGRNMPSEIAAPQYLQYADEPAELAEGTLVSGKYQIEGLIAAGGMGMVYRAWQPLIARTVALKIVRREILNHPDSTARFFNEARVLAQLETEHVCRVLDAGTLDDGVPYLVLEHLDGMDFRTLLNTSGCPAVPRLIDLMLQLLEALAEAHAAGIVHRDIKPENLFLSRPRGRGELVKLLDFGICRPADGARVSADGSCDDSLGSPQYMSPEQVATNAAIDERSDIWSVGVVMYELLTGRVPFDGESPAVICAQVLAREPTSLRELRRDVPPELEQAILRCLSKDPARRFADVAALAAALAGFGSEAARASQRRIELTFGALALDPIEAPPVPARGEAVQPVRKSVPAPLAPAVELAIEDTPSLESDLRQVTTVVTRRRSRTALRAVAVLAAGALSVAAVNAQPFDEPLLRQVAKRALAEAPHQLQTVVHNARIGIVATIDRYEAALFTANGSGEP
jgi:serine/threonine-protein kinase